LYSASAASWNRLQSLGGHPLVVDKIKDLDINDVARSDRALKGIVGKRLTYETPHK
jgi:hypothetical protein